MNKTELLEYLDSLQSNLVSDLDTVEKVVRKALLLVEDKGAKAELEYHLHTAIYYNEHTLANLKALRTHADSTF